MNTSIASEVITEPNRSPPTSSLSISNFLPNSPTLIISGTDQVQPAFLLPLPPPNVTPSPPKATAMSHSPSNNDSDCATKQGSGNESSSITAHEDIYQLAQLLNKQSDWSMGSLSGFLIDMEEHEEHHHQSKASNNNLHPSDAHQGGKVMPGNTIDLWNKNIQEVSFELNNYKHSTVASANNNLQGITPTVPNHFTHTNESEQVIPGQSPLLAPDPLSDQGLFDPDTEMDATCFDGLFLSSTDSSMPNLAPDPQQIQDMHVLELLCLGDIHDRLESISRQAQFCDNPHHRALGGPDILDPNVSDGKLSHGTGNYGPPRPFQNSTTSLASSTATQQAANTTANNSPPSRIRAFIHQLINHTNNVPQMPNGSKASFAQWGPAIFNSNTTTISPNCYNTARNSSQSQPVHGKQHHFPSNTDNDQKPGTASAFVMVTSTTKNKQIAQ